MDPIFRVHFKERERLLAEPTTEKLETAIASRFLGLLFNLLLVQPRPDYCIVVFDAPGADFRTSLFSRYKGHREPTPREILDSVPLIQGALDCLGIKWVQVHAVEADDVIGTLASKFGKEEVASYIFSRDKDFFQLINDNVFFVRGPMKDRSYCLYTSRVFLDEFGVEPGMWTEVMALQGDASDNVPGVYNIGEKRALSLVSRFGRIENIFENTDKMATGVIKRALLQPTARDSAMLSRRLVTIATDLNLPPLRFDIGEARVGVTRERQTAFLSYATRANMEGVTDAFGRYLEKQDR